MTLRTLRLTACPWLAAQSTPRCIDCASASGCFAALEALAPEDTREFEIYVLNLGVEVGSALQLLLRLAAMPLASVKPYEAASRRGSRACSDGHLLECHLGGERQVRLESDVAHCSRDDRAHPLRTSANGGVRARADHSRADSSCFDRGRSPAAFRQLARWDPELEHDAVAIARSTTSCDGPVHKNVGFSCDYFEWRVVVIHDCAPHHGNDAAACRDKPRLSARNWHRRQDTPLRGHPAWRSLSR